jgi:hypothetical protein
MTQPATPLPRLAEAPDPTHACIRCGRPNVPVDRALCEQCNPLELAQPSATQVHGIAALGIIIGIVVLAVLGRAALAGAGPFTGTVEGAVPATGGLAVTLVVTNEGTKTATTTCRVVEASRPVGGAGELIQTPSIAGGSSARFTVTVTKLGTTPVSLAADCQSP